MSYPSVEIANCALLRANAPQGHTLNFVCEFFDMDDSAGYAECSCGWKSRSVKWCWVRRLGDDHLREEAA